MFKIVPTRFIRLSNRIINVNHIKYINRRPEDIFIHLSGSDTLTSINYIVVKPDENKEDYEIVNRFIENGGVLNDNLMEIK